MGLKTKVRTLLDPEKRLLAQIASRRAAANQRRPFPLTADGLLRNLDQAKLHDLQARHYIPNPGIKKEKYLEFDRWLLTNAWRALDIGLDIQPPRRLLDLGSGAGFFLHVCNQLGHDVLGLDMEDPSASWYADLFALFGIRRVIWRIDPFVPLPDLGAKFDYVTAFMICFNRFDYPDAWHIDAWRFFLDDLQTRLNPKAVIWFELNPRSDGTHYDPTLKTFFESRGAIVDGKRLIWGMTDLQYRTLLKATKIETHAQRKGAPALAPA
jgi:SAM-dependent methyltransferase